MTNTIKALIEREAHFSALSSNIMATWEQREKEGGMVISDYYEIAGIMGLCPGHCDWHETLFPHLVDLFVSSEEEGRRLWDRVKNQLNLVKVMVTVMSDGMRIGQVIKYLERYMLSQGYARNYFRGENAYNAQCRPSLFRRLPDDPHAAKLHKIIGYLRITEFALWLNSLSFIQKWPYGDVFSWRDCTALWYSNKWH